MVILFKHVIIIIIISDITGPYSRPVDLDITEGVIMTRSNRMKFRQGRDEDSFVL